MLIYPCSTVKWITALPAIGVVASLLTDLEIGSKSQLDAGGIVYRNLDMCFLFYSDI